MTTRRSFLQGSLGAAAATTLALGPFSPEIAAQNYQISLPAMPDRSLYDQNEDAYWAAIRQQFVIPKDTIYLNNGTVGSSPLPVLKAVFDSYFDCEKLSWDDPERYPIWGYEPWNDYRDPLAAFLGVTRDELALVRNATEANNFMVNGFDMKPGDEVIMSDQEHPSGEGPWGLKAKRYGVVIKRYTIPRPVKDPSEILNLVNDQITPRTKVLFTSHISTFSGVIQPVKELCALARSKGIVSMIDGAHAPGMIRLNIKEIGCDMYGASPHKWLQAPKGTGFLYVRDEMIDRLWSTVTTHGWDDQKIRAERFQHIGSSNVPLLAGLKASLDFCNQIGLDRIEKRHRALNDYTLAEMQKRGAELWTSTRADMRCGIVSMNMGNIRIEDLEPALWKNDKIRVRGGSPSKIRLSTPYFLQKTEIDRFLERYDAFRKNYKASA
ncbi:MAG TPA: aminotransferase class V-fold PLP-dependent enzyme [Terriglobales bacterium]|nr:aminotransferase class V-fold PLP-dependent enzyme [Terriglobales bacterium]